MEVLFLATVALILLAIIALMLWRIERRLRPETYVLMQWNDPTHKMVRVDLLGGEYATIAIARAAAAELYVSDGEPILIVSTKHQLAVGHVPASMDPDSDLIACGQCGSEHAKRDLQWTAPEPDKLYGKLVCRDCWRAETGAQSR